MSTFEHVHPDFRHVMLLSDQERLDFLDQPRWVGYRAAQEVITMLQGLLRKPLRPRMPNLLLVGDANNGKTTIIRRFHSLSGQGSINEEVDPVIPVIIAEAPPSADEKGLYMSILERFFTPYRPTDSAAKLRYQVIHLFRACYVRMLIIDEFHSLLTGTPRKQREVMNAIKLLCNELAIPIVGVGTRDAVRVLHTDPQHASRFDVLSLPTWTLNEAFQRLVAGFEQTLPLKQCSRLYRPETATLLHSISEGNLGNLHRLLLECARVAIREGTECIDKPLIERHAWVRPTRGVRELML